MKKCFQIRSILLLMDKYPARSYKLGLLPYLIFIISIAITLYFWNIYNYSLKNRAVLLYKDITEDICFRIIEGMREDEQILRGAAGLLNANEKVTRKEWRQYVYTLRLDENYPGILGIGFSKWITPAEKEKHILEIRSEGFPNYTIRPGGDRPEYTSIIYLEPFDWRNQRAFGYDMLSEPIRRGAMQKARDEGKTIIAATIILVQETEKDRQNGMLIYVPVYRQGFATTSVEERRKALLGFAYSPIRINDFINTTLHKMTSDIAFDLYTSDTDFPESLLFSSIKAKMDALSENYRPIFQSEIKLKAFGRNWRIVFKTLPSFSKEMQVTASYGALAAGLLLSCLVAMITFILLTARDKAFAAANAYMESEEQFRSMFENHSSIMFLEDPETGKIIKLNQSAIKYYGYSPEEIAHLSVYQINQLSQEEIKKLIEKIKLRKENIFHFKHRLAHGEIRDVEVHSSTVPLKGKNFIFSIIHDITDRKMAEINLKASEEKYRNVLEILNAGVIVHRPDTSILLCNSHSCRLLGLTQEQMMGKEAADPAWRFINEDGSFLPLEDYPVNRVLNTLKPIYNQVIGIIRPLTNDLAWVLINGIPIFLNDDKISQVIISFVDITEIKKADEKLRDAMKQIESANLAKSAFLANMSHEIRTPMNAIIGMTRILLEMDSSPKQKHYLNIIDASGKGLLAIINDILDLSKIEANKIELDYEEVDLSHALKEIENILYPLTHNKYIEFTVEINGNPFPMIKSDPVRLKQILLNLGSNSIKFTDKGKVIISLSVVNETDTHVSVSFIIKDTGIGIPKDKIEQLFQPFSQLADHRQKKHKGTGLGLVISKRLVELMGGEIHVESKEGVGSTFWFTIPFEKVTTMHIKNHANPNLHSKNTPKDLNILVAEDNLFNQEVIIGVLKQHHLTIVNNGKEAVDILGKEPFDMVLMDIQMPEMDGITATKMIRDKNSKVMNHDIPIIAMTAYAMKEDRDLCIQTGMNGYITKPIDFKKLTQEIENLWIPEFPQIKSYASLDHHADLSKKVIFDSSSLLRVIDNDKTLALKLIKRFLDDQGYSKYLSEIKHAIDEKNAENLQNKAHTLKGMIGYFSSSGKELTSKLQEMGRIKDLSKVNETYESLTELISNLTPLLENFMRDLEKSEL